MTDSKKSFWRRLYPLYVLVVLLFIAYRFYSGYQTGRQHSMNLAATEQGRQEFIREILKTDEGRKKLHAAYSEGFQRMYPEATTDVVYQGKDVPYWISQLKDRDPQTSTAAMWALVYCGPRALADLTLVSVDEAEPKTTRTNALVAAVHILATKGEPGCQKIVQDAAREANEEQAQQVLWEAASRLLLEAAFQGN